MHCQQFIDKCPCNTKTIPLDFRPTREKPCLFLTPNVIDFNDSDEKYACIQFQQCMLNKQLDPNLFTHCCLQDDTISAPSSSDVSAPKVIDS